MDVCAKRIRFNMTYDENIESTECDGQILQGLPDHLAVECLARVPLSNLLGVSKTWEGVIYDPYFQGLRVEYGSNQLDWIYTLVQKRDKSFKWCAFDPLSSRWHDLPPVPHDMEFQLSNPGCIGVSFTVQCVSTKSKLVMVAGVKARRNAQLRMTVEPALEHPYIFDTRTGCWKRGSPFKVPRKWCVCGVAIDKVYVASGSGKDWSQELSKSAEIYNLENDKWEPLQNLSTSKFSGEAISAVSNNNKLYFVSGRGVFSKEGVVYDVITDSWSEMSPGLKKGWKGPCVAVDGKFYLLETPAGKLKVYAPERDEWDTIMVDSRLANLEVLIGTKGKIIAIEAASSKDDEISPGFLRVINIASNVPQILDIPVEEGQVVSVQVLAMMNQPSKLERGQSYC